MSTDTDRLGERVAAIEGTVEQMNERLGTIENRLDSIENRMDRLDGKIDNLRRWVAVAATVMIAFLAAVQVVVAIAL